ncbi:uncharacterized protein LOC121431046 [Lytechinus variegatus]|uniref:uncharacterized protein LOC121431046 n=1 Tax=Lytechinus variegatus TaxID=7654 RepID=UPI001BB151B7|nr:uncharacterized protein LOC121431046 [Lytechinus variegatus]
MGISQAGKAIMIAWIFCIMFVHANAQCSPDLWKTDSLDAPHYWTAWYNTDDPSDGVDIEKLASVRAVDSNVCASPTSVECRVRIAHLNSTDAAQALDQDCTNATAGLECQESSQPSGVKCYDYEIRFTCPPDSGALPEPNLHWELNGRTSASGKAPGWCNGRPKFYNTTIYSNTPGVADGAVNPNEHSTLLLEEGPSSSRHACALRSAVTGQANLGNFSDHCINDLQCCNHDPNFKGITVSVWINDHSVSKSTMPFIASGAQQSNTRGFTLDKRNAKQFAFLFRYDVRKVPANISPAKPQLLTPYGTWAHYILSSDRRNTRIYHNGINHITQNFSRQTPDGIPSTLPLLLFAKNPDVNDLDTTPDVSISNLKIFYRKFTQAEAQKLYAEEIGTLSVSSEDIVHILYVVQVSDPSDPNILVECVARGPGKDMVPSINWFILDADGMNYSALDQSGLKGRVYTELVSDNYRIKSALQLINYGGNASVVCEAVDDATGARKASRSELYERNYNWTTWMSFDAPYLHEDGMDNESIALLQEETCENPIDIECRTLYTHIPSFMTTQSFDVSCTVEGGLVCIGSSQSSLDNFTCFDYEVRLLCPQQPIYWTSWFNVDDGTDDKEMFSTHQGLDDPTLCASPVFAQCRVFGTATPWASTNVVLDYPYACTPEGLVCLGANNTGNGGCQDFEVRYACPYPTADSPLEYWDLSGRLTVGGTEPVDCNSHDNNNIYSNTGGLSGSSSTQIEYTDAPQQLSQTCAVMNTDGHITLGNYDGKCLSKIGWCPDGMTVSMWIKQITSAGTANMVFFTSGGDESDSNGFAFIQSASDKKYYAYFRSDGLVWDEIIVPQADVTIGEWFHVTLTFKDADEGKIYIDGSLKGSTDVSTLEKNSHDVKDDFVIGSSQSGSDSADAAFSAVKFFDYVLTDEAVMGLYFCEETATDPEVLSLTIDSHRLNPHLKLTCQVKGYPLTGVKWFMTTNVDTTAKVYPIQTSLSRVISEDRSDCIFTSQLEILNYVTDLPFGNVTFICSGEFNQKKDFATLFVEWPTECERAIGFGEGDIRLVQISSSFTYSGVPSINGGIPWVSTFTDQSAYIEFDFGLRHQFAGLVVQGTPSSFVSSYEVSYSDAPSGPLTSHSTLAGGHDAVWKSFDPVIESRIVRLRSLDTDGTDQILVEFYGCAIEEPELNLTALTSSYNSTTDVYTLYCQGSYFPPPVVTWLADDQVISEPRYVTGQEIEGVRTYSKELELRDFVLADEEVVFTCVISADGANVTQNIQTEYGFNGLISVVNTTDIRYLQTVSFSCTALGDDVYTMEWYFTNTTHTTPTLLQTGNGVTTGGFTVGDSPGVFTLSVQMYKEENEGTYQCSVNQATSQMNITTNADILLVVTLASPHYHQVNTSYTLTCTVVHYGGNPSAIEWTLPNGTLITGSDSNGTYQVSETTGVPGDISTLTMQGEYLVGAYICTGRTDKDAWTDTVNISEGDSFKIASISGAYNFTHLYYSAECVATFVGPPPTVTWVTPEGTKHTTSGDGNVVVETVTDGTVTKTLKISSTNLTRYDGNYTCIVSGNGTVDVQDDVWLKSAYEGDLTLNVTERIQLGDDVRLTCTASQGESVIGFTWSKVVNETATMPVVQDEIFQISEVAGGSSRFSVLEIAMFSRIDEGTYECSVNSRSKTAKLPVGAVPGNTLNFFPFSYWLVLSLIYF